MTRPREHAGANLAVWAESTTGCVCLARIAPAPSAGAQKRSGRLSPTFFRMCGVARPLIGISRISFVLFAALAHGTSRSIVPRETEHLATNLWLIGQFGARGARRAETGRHRRTRTDARANR